ncbi:MAG: hypothetical protein HOA15_02080 [Candidatus Marinimicrobia bacterium]|jgi:hypothetical protein|nr:hypothetical protein [Candidatus Neomarinimicrobiota bacterium]MBT4069378.1 hypothetical protein [Candidatus Neomarinimicrobiota bacterium]MBT4808666.1 hypothetical protein [Candidatus Neomarinimicrobiota bacterium]MBT6129806.1 hypothetical protein [Candidatus Neomarinimicrobiota bacterium]MBT6636648.1 hypothetical protein [Candidatus Neomarinimicrobiota bacterium]
MKYQLIITILCAINISWGQFGGLKEIDPFAIYKMTNGKIIPPEEAIRLTVVESYSAITSMDDDGSNKTVLIYKSYNDLKGYFSDDVISQMKKWIFHLEVNQPFNRFKIIGFEKLSPILILYLRMGIF